MTNTLFSHLWTMPKKPRIETTHVPSVSSMKLQYTYNLVYRSVKVNPRIFEQ